MLQTEIELITEHITNQKLKLTHKAIKKLK